MAGVESELLVLSSKSRNRTILIFGLALGFALIASGLYGYDKHVNNSSKVINNLPAQQNTTSAQQNGKHLSISDGKLSKNKTIQKDQQDEKLIKNKTHRIYQQYENLTNNKSKEKYQQEKNQLSGKVTKNKRQLQIKQNRDPVHVQTKSSVKNCSVGWKQWGDHCYLFSTLRKTWPQGWNYCQGENGNLLNIAALPESTFITEELHAAVSPSGNRLVWFGANDRATEGDWTWADGSKIIITNWRYGEPNDSHGNEDCGSIYQRRGASWLGLWNDIPCNAEYLHFVCKKSM